MLKAKLMDFHLDGLLNLPDITIERCIKNDKKTILKVGFLRDNDTCPREHLTFSAKLEIGARSQESGVRRKESEGRRL